MSIIDEHEEDARLPDPVTVPPMEGSPLDYPKDLKGWIVDLIKTEIRIDDLIGAAGLTLVPIGGIILWEEAALPEDGRWIECDGASINAEQFPELKAMRANAPDYRGKTPVGQAASGTFATLGGTVGVETVTLTSAQSGLPAHNHTASLSATPLSDGTHNLAFPAGGTNWGFVLGASVTVNNNTAADAAASHTNIQPSRVTRFIMRAR